MGLISPLAQVFLFVISCKGDIGRRGGRFPWCPWENPAHQWWSLVISFQGIFPRHLMEKVGEEKVGDLVPRLHHHMRKKNICPTNNAFEKPPSAWEFEFLVHIYKEKWHIIIALFFLEKTMLFSCFTPPAKQASINGNHSPPCGNTRLHVPTSRFLPRNCNGKRGQRWDPSAWGILVDRDFWGEEKNHETKALIFAWGILIHRIFMSDF